MRRLILYLIIVAFLIALVVGVVTKNKEALEVKKPLKVSTEEGAIKSEVATENAFIKVARDVGKAVVAISTERTQKVGYSTYGRKPFGKRQFRGKDPFQEFFERFFGPYPEREFKQRGLGSGFILDKKGHILTNYHVIEGADKILITLSDGRSFKGLVKGSDPRSDIAVVKIDAKNLPLAELGNSDLAQIGEWVIALGNPFGHILQSPEPTVTVGVISALHRKIPTPNMERGYLDMIQTDAAINPGNSGGPLCNLNGKVIAINVAIFSTSGGYQGVGFAIPINLVKEILDNLIRGEEIEYGWLGVVAQEITPEIADYFNLPDQKGALVSEVVPGSPADKGGLKEGDIVKRYNGKEIRTVHDLLKAVGSTGIGFTARLEILRDRVRQEVKIKIEKRPPHSEITGTPGGETKEVIKSWRGMKVMNITDEVAGELGLMNKEGIVILEVELSTPSYNAGLMRGDVIWEINRTKIRNIIDFERITKEARGPALLRTERMGYITVSS